MGVAVDLTTEVGTVRSIHGSVSAVAAAVNQLVLTYAVPVGKTAKLQRIEFSGTNIAIYSYFLNATLEGQRHTWHSGPMFGEFNFIGSNQEGILITAGDVVEVRAEHNRPFIGDFDVRVQVLEIS